MEENSSSLWTAVPVTTVACLNMIQCSIVMPSMFKYIQHMGTGYVVYSLCASLFSLSQLVSGYFYVAWARRRFVLEPLVTSLLVSLVGNVLYASASYLSSATWILVGRNLVGFGSGTSALVIFFIREKITPASRARAYIAMNISSVVGIMLGPVIILGMRREENSLFNELTNPGWFGASLSLSLAIMIWLTLREHSVSPLSNYEPLNSSISLEANGDNVTRWKSALIKTLDKRHLWIHLMISFCSTFILSLLETALPILSVDFQWDVQTNSFMYCSVGLIVVCASAFALVLVDRIEERVQMMVGILLSITGLTISFLTVCEVWWCVSLLFLSAGSPMITGPNASLYTSRLEETEDTGNLQPVFMSMLSCTNGGARVLAPICISLYSQLQRTGLYVVVSVCLGFILITYLAHFESFRTKSIYR